MCDGMKYRRYGTFRFLDYKSAWLFASFYALFGLVGTIYKVQWYLCLVFILIGVGIVVELLLPLRETFEIKTDEIISCRGRKVEKMKFPSQFIVVVSDADMCTDLAKRVTVHNNTYILKEKYAISILQDVPVEIVLKTLHGKYAYRYTNCSIEEHLKHYFIYSFVCNQDVLERTLAGKRYVLILPEKLVDKVNVEPLEGVIYYDKGF